MAVAMAMLYLRRALLFSSVPSRSLQLAAAVPGLDVLGRSTFAAEVSLSVPHSALQGFRDFSSAYSSPAFKLNKTSACDVHEYNKLISALNNKRRPYLVREVYDDMLLDGVKPIDETFFLLIDGCMKASRLQDVMYFFEEMKAMGLTPDVVLYNCVIAACGKSMLVDLAFQVAEEMEASGIQPRHRTFLTLMRSCAIAGRVDEAYGVVRRMAASGLSLDNNFYCALIIAHKNKKPHTVETIQKIFELLEQSKQQSAEDLMAVAATGEFDDELSTDDIDDGLANMLLSDRQPRRGFINRRLAVYHAAVKSLSTLGNKEAVKTVLKLVEMDGHELDSYCIIQLIKCDLAEGNFEQACAEYSKYVETGRQPTLELYVMLIEAALDNRSPESSAMALKLLDDFVQSGYFLNAQLGNQLMARACREKSRDIAVANVLWDILKNREIKTLKITLQKYYQALEESNLPNDHPRLIELKAFLDDGRSVKFKRQADLAQTTPSDDLPKQMVKSEQDSL